MDLRDAWRGWYTHVHLEKIDSISELSESVTGLKLPGPLLPNTLCTPMASRHGGKDHLFPILVGCSPEVYRSHGDENYQPNWTNQTISSKAVYLQYCLKMHLIIARPQWHEKGDITYGNVYKGFDWKTDSPIASQVLRNQREWDISFVKRRFHHGVSGEQGRKAEATTNRERVRVRECAQPKPTVNRLQAWGSLENKNNSVGIF